MTKHREHHMHAHSLVAYATSDFGPREQAILKVLGESAVPLTDREVAERLAVHRSEVQPRITEMVDAHILCQAATVKCKTTGRPVRAVAVAVPVQGTIE